MSGRTPTAASEEACQESASNRPSRPKQHARQQTQQQSGDGGSAWGSAKPALPPSAIVPGSWPSLGGGGGAQKQPEPQQGAVGGLPGFDFGAFATQVLGKKQ